MLNMHSLPPSSVHTDHSEAEVTIAQTNGRSLFDLGEQLSEIQATHEMIHLVPLKPAVATSSREANKLMSLWFQQIQNLPYENAWLHLPDHKGNLIKLRVHKNQIVFGPRKSNKLFLDYAIYQDDNQLAQKLQALTKQSTHKTPYLISEPADDPFSPTEREEMAQLVHRLFTHSASLIGHQESLLTFSKAIALDIENPVLFDVESLLPQRAQCTSSEDVQLFERLVSHAKLVWHFANVEELNWTSIVNGPKSFSLSQAQHLMNASTAIGQRLSALGSDTKLWTGQLQNHYWSFVFTPQSILAIQIEKHKYPYVMAILHKAIQQR